jgi:repressor LexA
VDIGNEGSIYLVNTKDGLFVKYINIENDKVILKSTNPNFSDVIFNINDVNIVRIVCGVFIKVKI